MAIALAKRMSINSVSSLTNNSYLEQILNSALQTYGASANTSNSNNAVSLAGQNSDASQLSPFAQILSTLQELQQSNPTEYATLTQQIATNLQIAAQTDTADGNTSGASELTQLANDFTTASTSGQLPIISDLAQAIGGGAQGPPPPPPATDSNSSDSSSTSSMSSSSASSIFQQLEQLLASLQASGNTSQSLTPQSIILQTLANAGISSSGS